MTAAGIVTYFGLLGAAVATAAVLMFTFRAIKLI